MPNERGNPPMTDDALRACTAYLAQALAHKLTASAPEPDVQLLAVDAVRGSIKALDFRKDQFGKICAVKLPEAGRGKTDTDTFFYSPAEFLCTRLLLAHGDYLGQNRNTKTDAPPEEQKWYVRQIQGLNVSSLRFFSGVQKGESPIEAPPTAPGGHRDLRRGFLGVRPGRGKPGQTREDALRFVRRTMAEQAATGTYSLRLRPAAIEALTRLALDLVDDEPLGEFLGSLAQAAE